MRQVGEAEGKRGLLTPRLCACSLKGAPTAPNASPPAARGLQGGTVTADVMAGVGAAAAVAAAPAAGLPASYAAVQSTLRRQFFGDLVELRGALVNTLNLEPQRASNLHQKLQLIDAALRMLEVGKGQRLSCRQAMSGGRPAACCLTS